MDIDGLHRVDRQSHGRHESRISLQRRTGGPLQDEAQDRARRIVERRCRRHPHPTSACGSIRTSSAPTSDSATCAPRSASQEKRIKRNTTHTVKIKNTPTASNAFSTARKVRGFFNFAYSIGAAIVIWGIVQNPAPPGRFDPALHRHGHGRGADVYTSRPSTVLRKNTHGRGVPRP